MPDGADAVVMVEETERATATEVRVFTPVYPRQNVGRQGADIVRGQVVLRAGDVLNPSRIGALAALGALEVEVFAQPTVAILSTGNEIVDPGRKLLPGRSTTSTSSVEHDHRGAREHARPVPDGGRHGRGSRAGRSTRASPATCWCSRAAARWANAT